MKKLLFVCLALCVVSATALGGEWVFQDAVIVGWAIATDEGEAAVNLRGFKNPYGVTVDPDGNIWCSAYYQRYYYAEDGVTRIYPDDLTITTPDTTYEIGTYPLFIKKTDGTFDSLMFLNFPDGSQDTLTAGSRGMATDHEGNIIYANNNYVIYKINYQTYEVIAKYEFDFSPARPAVDADGYVFFTGLFGGTVTILDPDDWSAPYNTVPDVTVSVCRTLSVSPDGKNIYVADYAGGAIHYYSEDGVDGAYAIVDTILKEIYVQVTPDSIDTVTVECNLVQWDPAGLLWVGTREEATPKIMWALDPANDYAIVDSSSFTWWANTDMTDTTTGGYAQPQYLRCPRDAAFSPDGNTMYIADMYSYVIKAYEYVEVGVEPDDHVEVPAKFSLLQNYPNPFNPTTAIPFALSKKGFVELKVYDIMGREVVTLIGRPMVAGRHEVTFDGSGQASGVYYYRLKMSGLLETKKMLLIK